MSRTFIEADEVAGLIGYRSGATFKQHRRELEDTHGFPVPMPTSLRPLLWRREEVEAWVHRQGCAGDAPAPSVSQPHMLRLASTA